MCEFIAKTSGKRQFINREYPIGVRVEFPIRVRVTLLKRVVSAHAEEDRDHVGLRRRELIGGRWQVRRIAILREDMTGHGIIAARVSHVA